MIQLYCNKIQLLRGMLLFYIYPELYSLEVQNGPIIIRPVA